MFRSQTQLAARRTLLRRGVIPLIDQGAHLDQILNHIISNVEGQAEQMLAAIFFYDPASQELSVGSAPNLQPNYLKAVNGFKIGPNHASCGTAVFRRQRIINHDVITDPLWQDFQFAKDFFRAVWSEPLFSEDGEVLGTLAFYFQQPKSPDASDLVILETAGQLVSLAIQARKDQFAEKIAK